MNRSSTPQYMRFFSSLVVAAILGGSAADAATLPGFRYERVGSVTPYLTSLAVDSRGIIYYTSISGTLFRFEGGQSIPIGTVTTVGEGNSGLLGMALLDDRTAVVHYTTPEQTQDVIAKIDLKSGEESIVQRFYCDGEVPDRGTSTEHHGGNPIVAPDGSIYVGIGDYGRGHVAAIQKSNGGKVFRIDPQGRVMQYALGFRNPFDLVWDPIRRRVIIADNGPAAGDELHIIEEGANCGWPYSYGYAPVGEGVTPPDYVFAKTVAPTGNLLLAGNTPYLRRGYLLSAYVSKAIYYFPDLDARPIPDPITLIERETASIIDVAQSPSGDIYFATGNSIYRLLPPERGDCDGNGKLDGADFYALERELADGTPEPTLNAQNGTFRASWGCDANVDGVISTDDLAELSRIISVRRRAIRSAR